MWSKIITTGIFCGLLSTQLIAAPEETQLNQTPSIEPGITEKDLNSLLASNLAKSFKPQNEMAFSEEDIKFWAKKAKQIHAKSPTTVGDINQNYDAIIQIGHYPRTTGRTGGHGSYVTEQEMAALVAVGIKQKLSSLKIKNKPINVILIGADDFTPQLKSRIFISLHTDSSSSPCSVKPSVGYQQIGDAKGMHGIALALAITLNLDAEKFMKDNYTKNLSGYYAYSKLNTKDFKGVLEMSELSCPAQEKQLLERAATLSENLAVAIQFALL